MILLWSNIPTTFQFSKISNHFYKMNTAKKGKVFCCVTYWGVIMLVFWIIKQNIDHLHCKLKKWIASAFWFLFGFFLFFVFFRGWFSFFWCRVKWCIVSWLINIHVCFRIKAYITKATKRCTNPWSLELQYISNVIHAAIDHGRVSS